MRNRHFWLPNEIQVPKKGCTTFVIRVVIDMSFDHLLSLSRAIKTHECILFQVNQHFKRVIKQFRLLKDLGMMEFLQKLCH